MRNGRRGVRAGQGPVCQLNLMLQATGSPWRCLSWGAAAGHREAKTRHLGRSQWQGSPTGSWGASLDGHRHPCWEVYEGPRKRHLEADAQDSATDGCGRSDTGGAGDVSAGAARVPGVAGQWTATGTSRVRGLGTKTEKLCSQLPYQDPSPSPANHTGASFPLQELTQDKREHPHTQRNVAKRG